MTVAFYLVGLLFGVLAFWWAFRQSGQRHQTKARPVLDDLHTACMGDAAQAQRLERYERRFSPWMSRKTARRRAVDRLTRDRGGRW